MSYIFPQEREVLEMLAGLRPRTSEVWVNTCLKNLIDEGYCTEGPNHRLTAEGREILGLIPANSFDRPGNVPQSAKSDRHSCDKQLDPAVYNAWVDPATQAADAKGLPGRNLDGKLQFHQVSRAVNSTKDRSDSAEMIEPANPI